MTVSRSTMTNGLVTERRPTTNTLTGLKRWSCLSKELPCMLSSPFMHPDADQRLAVSKIRALHIYDFDNTCSQPESRDGEHRCLYSLVFRSPLPNPKLWNPYSASRLQNQDVFSSGGWWHDERILEATGEGIDAEEPRAWSGWWNEQIVRSPNLLNAS